MSVLPVPGQADRELSISWSRLKDQEECGEKAYLLSRGFRSPVVDLRVFFRGTVVDRCMRKWLDLDDPQPGWMAEMVDLILDESVTEAKDSGDGIVSWKGPGDKEAVRDWCRTCVTRLEPLLFRVAIPYEYQPAVRFKVPITIPYLDNTPQRIYLNGEMDLLCQLSTTEPRQLSVWDLKGTENDAYWRKVLGQLVFYEIAAFAMLKEWPVSSGILQPMCQQQVLNFTFTADHRREMLARIQRVANQQWTGIHRPKESDAGCNWCPVQHACPKFAIRRGKAPLR